MAVNKYIQLIVSFTMFFYITGLDVCEDKSTDCQPCNSSYPVPTPYRDNCMKTCQVCTNDKNVALNQITKQSSLGQNFGQSHNAVDGNTNGIYNARSCTHTGYTGTHWWCVDLKKIYNIKNITVYNRNNLGDRLQGFELKTASNGQCNAAGFNTSSPCYKNDPPTNQIIYTTAKCNQNPKSISAGTLFVSVKNRPLTICEFQVFTGTTCSYGYYNTPRSSCEPCDGCFDNNCNPDTGDCIGVCKPGVYGTKCQQNCSEGCENKQCTKSDGNCSCINGWFGSKCQLTCNTGCKDKVCNQSDGRCSQGCTPGRYGDQCNETCSQGCSTTDCNRDGSCTCRDGYKGSYCQTPCDVTCRRCDDESCSLCKSGWFGTKCETRCPTGCKEACNKTSGTCNECNRDGSCTCKSGFHGERCSFECDDKCNNNSCTSSSSSSPQCTNGCVDGYKGSYCQTPCDVNCRKCDDESCSLCKSGWFGMKCEKRCTTGCKEACNKTSGICDGCKEGTVGLYCDIRCGGDCRTVTEEEIGSSMCKEGDCQISCNNNCNGSSCEQGMDECRYKCIGGKQTDMCIKEKDDKSTGNPVTAVAVSVCVVLLLVIAVIILVIVVLKRRKRNKFRADEGLTTCPTAVFTGEVVSVSPENVLGKTETKGSIYENVTTEANICNYQNNDVVVRSSTRIDITDLIDYIKQRKTDNSFKGEYQTLPSGLCAAYDYGLNTVNKLKNRYKNMCAFDHSRVKLDQENDDPYSDYINACYITGFGNVEQKYIASQGPVTNMIVEFWRMVWFVDSGKIVMLTNLQEIGVQKCLQYWPNMGKVKQFGKITIRHVEENIFSHFAIRKLKVEKEGWDPRYVEQFHYMAWPDKSIPGDIPSLIEFTDKVNQSSSTLTGPTVVHCSAGIGRTGTFIGLDYLIEEGRKMGSVDVVKCVEQMRYERVNMVQTLGQYIFLHEALVEAFVCGYAISVTLHKEQIRKFLATKENGFKEMFKKIQSVGAPVTNDRFKTAMSEGNKHKNRDMSVLPLDEFRLYLPYSGDNSSDYINAVPLPSYRKKTGYIITQTPLKETVLDFWKMLMEAEVEIVVNMDSTESHDDVGDYLPEDDQLVFGDFTVTKIDEKQDGHGFYSVLTLRVQKKNDGNFKKTIKFYLCQFWKSGRTEVSPMLDLLDDVQSTSSDNKTGPPIAVMCLNGVTKSGLFCVLAAVIERMNIEQRVNILLTILQLRLYRPQIIISPNQLQFCVDTVCEYVEKYSIYANAL